jgi:hypothetical protein
MLIQCPKCERKGDIPDRFGLSPHSVRCRRCKTQFMTVPFAAGEHGDLVTTASDEAPDAQIVVDLSGRISPSVGAIGDGKQFGPLPDARGPGDSHYEWPVINDVDIDDSQVDLPAFSADDDWSSDEMAVLESDASSDEIPVAEPAPLAATGPGARFRFVAAILIRVLSLAIFGFFVLQGVLNAQTVGLSIAALVAGCLGIGGLLLLSMARDPHPRLLNDFTGSVRRAGPHADIDRPIASDRSVAR